MLFLQYLTIEYTPHTEGIVYAADNASTSSDALDNMAGTTLAKKVMTKEMAKKFNDLYERQPTLDETKSKENRR